MEERNGVLWTHGGELTDLLADRTIVGPFEPQRVVANSFPFFQGIEE